MTFDRLAHFPRELRETFAAIPAHQMRIRIGGLFAPIEQAWHLADLEVEGYGARIEQLLRVDDPHFADFQGDVIATQRRYIELELESALQRFEQARAMNVARLRAATREQRARRATQEGVDGPVTLARIAEMMAEHDASHAAEIARLVSSA
ncbi:MAG TPA: DinB family protein [Thermoanaerobaculia bacterium]|jgi:hypothetical protein